MAETIENHADCEVRSVIRFLQAENVRPCDIHCRLVTIYCEDVINAASVRKWCIMFKNGRTDVHDEERSRRPSVITDTGTLKRKVDRIIRENRLFMINETPGQSQEVSNSTVHEIVTQHLRVPQNLCTVGVTNAHG